MKTKITLEEFLFVLNGDEDLKVSIIDYMSDEDVVRNAWKSDIQNYSDYSDYKNSAVEYFITGTINNETTLSIYIRTEEQL